MPHGVTIRSSHYLPVQQLLEIRDLYYGPKSGGHLRWGWLHPVKQSAGNESFHTQFHMVSITYSVATLNSKSVRTDVEWLIPVLFSLRSDHNRDNNYGGRNLVECTFLTDQIKYRVSRVSRQGEAGGELLNINDVNIFDSVIPQCTYYACPTLNGCCCIRWLWLLLIESASLSDSQNHCCWILKARISLIIPCKYQKTTTTADVSVYRAIGRECKKLQQYHCTRGGGYGGNKYIHCVRFFVVNAIFKNFN